MKKRLVHLLPIILVVAIILMIVLSIVVSNSPILNLDVSISRDIQSEGDSTIINNIIHGYLNFVSFLGTYQMVGLLTLFFAGFFYLYNYHKEAIAVLILPVSVGINAMLKTIINRPRPSSDLVSIYANESSASFPSSHVVFFTVFFGFLILLMLHVRRVPKIIRAIIASISLLLIISVSFSRVYLGVHWPTDVLGGYIFGLILLILAYYLFNKFGRDKI